MQATTGKDSLFRAVCCPLCEASPDRFKRITRAGNYRRGETTICMRCGLVFLNNRIQGAQLRAFYESDAFSVEYRGSASPTPEAIAYRDERALRRWQHIRKLTSKPASWLEIGCSSGNFLDILRSDGHKARGIDPSRGYATYARSRGMDVALGLFPDDMPAEWTDFDFVVTFHTIEHVEEPATLLTHARGLLRPEGHLVLEYPDISRAAARLRLAPSYFHTAHVFDFSLTTMEALLQRCGFEVVSVMADNVPAADKNVLLVARKTGAASAPSWDAQSARQLYAELRRKLRRDRIARVESRIRTCVQIGVLLMTDPAGFMRRVWRRLAGNRRP